MHGKALKPQVYSKWDGRPFFEGQPEEGRQVYIETSLKGFVGSGVMDGVDRILFEVHGTHSERPSFEAQVRSEGAAVFLGPPPTDTNAGGTKAGSGTDRPGLTLPEPEKASALRQGTEGTAKTPATTAPTEQLPDAKKEKP
ncbi:hypothetical protein JYK02_23345 [Corallococcus macrosporus]|uniref:Uncharacterized protein n=1 Tax=Corallococcus macrosporus TaxID=35 RepID=A0ABS3DGI3_9BACT|nr:hypothetical protein [Corallococcus macrosporus]MBN8230452.1 hypothetical protein [Corallococcus macrosporus]